VSSYLPIWLCLLAACGAACLFLPDSAAEANPESEKAKSKGLTPRAIARRAFIGLLTVFVGSTFALSMQKHGSIGRSEPVIDTDRAEIVLRIESAIEAIGQKFGLQDFAHKKGAEHVPHAEAKTVLEESVKKNPESWQTEAKLAVVLGDTGREHDKQELAKLLRKMTAAKVPAESELARALQDIYVKNKVEHGNVARMQALFEKNFPKGWYRNAVLMRLYKLSGETAKFDALRNQIVDHGEDLIFRLLALVFGAALACLIGIITIIVQLFVLPRHIGRPEDERNGAEAVPWGLGTVYSIFIMWMATQLVLGGLAQSVIKSTGLMTAGALPAALATAGVYLLSNGPGIFYIYWFACRPYNLKLTEFLRFRFRTDKAGPIKLVLTGVLAWCSALPIVLISYAIASRFLGSQGSSNPVIGLVMDAARSADYTAVILFYLTLAVLAPLCEETLFRGFLYRSFRKYIGVGTALLLSGAMFGAVHLDPGAVLPLMALGWVFGFVYERSRSLVPAMVAHGCWNAGTFTLLLMIFGD
jgi:membrane protease YdiL (CAAX protease family)